MMFILEKEKLLGTVRDGEMMRWVVMSDENSEMGDE